MNTKEQQENTAAVVDSNRLSSSTFITQLRERSEAGISTFVVFEGLDGSGKTTQAKMLAEQLRSLDFEVYLTREPGGMETAERIRETILMNDLLPISETLLFVAARFEHAQKFILPFLNTSKGCIVISDRYVGSTLAFQSSYDETNWMFDYILDLHDEIDDRYPFPVPDVTFYMHMDPEDAIARLQDRDTTNRLDALDDPLALYAKRQENYMKGFDECQLAGNWVAYIDANQSIVEVNEEIIQSSFYEDAPEIPTPSWREAAREQWGMFKGWIVDRLLKITNYLLREEPASDKSPLSKFIKATFSNTK